MRFLLLAAALAVTAAEPDTRILRLIGPDTRSVTGIDVERFAPTRLAAQFPLPIEFLFPVTAPESLRIQRIVTLKTGELAELTIVIGESAAEQAFQHEQWSAVSPAQGILFIGETETVEAALAAWRDTGRPLTLLAERVKEVAGRYDNWTVMLDPIPDERRGVAPPELPHWDSLRSSVREFAAGIRFGGQHECFAAVRMATHEDAEAAAALARWLPGIMQKDTRMAPFVSAATSIEIRRNGTSVELTFLLPDDATPAPLL